MQAIEFSEVCSPDHAAAAEEAGAAGCIIYSDPGDDGEKTEANGYELASLHIRMQLVLKVVTSPVSHRE